MKPTAVVGRRVLAFLIDALIVGAINSALFIALADPESEILAGLDAGEEINAFVNVTLGDETYSVTGGKAVLFFAVTALIGFLYWVVLQGLRGVTIGKGLTGIRLVRDDGSRAGIWRSFVRQFLWIADAFPYLIPYLTGFLTALLTRNNKRIGDMAAGTLVVRKGSAPSAAGAPVAPHAPEAQAPESAPSPTPAPAPTPQAPTPAASPPPGWHPDPKGEKRLRYWDGTAWTDHTAD